MKRYGDGNDKEPSYRVTTSAWAFVRYALNGVMKYYL